MSFEVITIGAATVDAFLISRGLRTLNSPEFPRGKGECFALGTKIEIDDLYFDIGGGGTNTAATFANLGLKTSTVIRIGQDELGKQVLESLKKHRVDTSLVVTDLKEHTAYGTIMLVPEEGDRTIFIYRGASAYFVSKDIPLTKLKCKWLYLTSLHGEIELIEKIVSSSKKKNVQIAFNPGNMELQAGLKNLLPILRHVDVLLLNREEAINLSELGSEADIKELFEAIAVAIPGIIAITDGANGAYLCPQVDQEAEILYAKARQVKSLNSTGAGDAFGAGLVAGLIKFQDPEKALRLATLNAAGVIQKMGAKHGLLTSLPSQNKLNEVAVERL